MKCQRPMVWPVWGGTRARAELNGAREGQAIVVDSAAWFEWLAAETTTGFAYALFDRQVGYVRGFLTVRKERRARGGSYWVAAELETIGEAALALRDGSIQEGGACDQQTRK